MINSTTFSGRLGADPETISAGDNTVTKFSLCHSYKYREKEHTTWLSCEAWGKGGEIIQKYARKGQTLTIQGPLQEDEWTDNQGNTRRKLKVRVNDFTLPGKSDGGGQTVAPQASQVTAAKPTFAVESEEEDTLPF